MRVTTEEVRAALAHLDENTSQHRELCWYPLTLCLLGIMERLDDIVWSGWGTHPPDTVTGSHPPEGGL